MTRHWSEVLQSVSTFQSEAELMQAGSARLCKAVQGLQDTPSPPAADLVSSLEIVAIVNRSFSDT